jgi:hypothetical protein
MKKKHDNILSQKAILVKNIYVGQENIVLH